MQEPLSTTYVEKYPVTYLPVEISELEVEQTTGEAAKAQVRAEACWAGEQWVGIHSGTLKVGHPSLSNIIRYKIVWDLCVT